MRAIYKITNQNTGMCYVGSASNHTTRWANHRYLLRRDRHPNSRMQRSWNAHGEDAFSFEIIEELGRDADIIQHETWWVHHLQTLDRRYGFNLCVPAEGALGYKHPPEFGAAVSARLRGREKSPEHQAAINAALRGRKLSPEHCLKIGDTHRGRKHTPEAREKMRRSSAARLLTPDLREKFATRRGKTHSPEARARIGAASRARVRTPEMIERMKAAAQLREQRKRELRLSTQPEATT